MPSVLMSCVVCVFRRYLPRLKGFPSRYIYEPWNAPESIQKAAKCIIGVDYPRPIVNHAETSRLNIERMKQIYQQLSRYRGLCKEPLLPPPPPRTAPVGSEGIGGRFPDICKGRPHAVCQAKLTLTGHRTLQVQLDRAFLRTCGQWANCSSVLWPTPLTLFPPVLWPSATVREIAF